MNRVNAIRNHPKVGRGSCTSIDECFTDQELIDCLDAAGVSNEKDAVKWAVDHEGLQLEKALDQRWGEDDDWQLVAYNEWNK